MATDTDTAIISPYVIVIDSREQHPYDFMGFRADADRGKRPLVIRTKIEGLASGDYSLEGFETEISVERKSKSDLFSTLSQGRDRFINELERLSLMRFAAVVVEADWADIINNPPDRSSLAPKNVYRSVIAWQEYFPNVHWWFCHSRDFAQHTTFRILDRHWRIKEWEQKQTEKGILSA